jgi:tRNA pseudouridine38-40 synthase
MGYHRGAHARAGPAAFCAGLTSFSPTPGRRGSLTTLLLLHYRGTDLLGAAEVAGGRTVVGELRAALARLGESGCEVEVLSRTDAGVHARGQVAVVRGLRRLKPEALWIGLRHQLPVDLRCVRVAEVGEVPRVLHKTYRYSLDLSAVGDPFMGDLAWRPPAGVEVGVLQEAGACVPGRRDFRAFRRRGETREDLVRNVISQGWAEEGGLWVWTVTGEGFAYRLVRSLVGGMVAVARGGLSMAAWRAALAGEVSEAGRQQAPAHGLCLSGMVLEGEVRWWSGGGG